MKSTTNRAVAAAPPVLAVLCWAGAALAQTATQPAGGATAQGQLGEVTVEAHHEVQRKQVGRTSSGIPVEVVSVSHHVGFQGVGDPVSTQGRAELDKRIQTAAEEGCKQLKDLYPLDQWGESDQRTCVSNAVKDAEKQLDTMIASGRVPR